MTVLFEYFNFQDEVKHLQELVKRHNEEKCEYLKTIRDLQDQIVAIKVAQEKNRKDEIRRKMVMALKV